LNRAASIRAGPLDECVEWKLQRELELLGPPWKEQREDRISQQARFGEIGARNTEVDERGLEGRALPEGDSDGLFLGEAVSQIHIRRKRWLIFKADSRRHSFANGRVEVGARRRAIRGRTGRGPTDQAQQADELPPCHSAIIITRPERTTIS
jgi:hypothetical protein